VNSLAGGSGDERSITLVSTHTIDEISGPDGHTQRRPGGPAHYVGAALDRLGFRYKLITGSRPRVQVISDIDGEQYLIPAIPPIALPTTIECCAAILSPVIGEIEPGTVPAVDGLLVVDVQGFVREPGVPSGRVSRKFDLSSVISRADVVKAGERELGLLDTRSKKLLGRTTFIETRGSRGAVIHLGARSYTVGVREVREVDTIGAGDTFLAAFVVAILKGADELAAGESAGRFTSEILTERRVRAAQPG
jgi:sugar/nucleoside kinase (ribokinase family)